MFPKNIHVEPDIKYENKFINNFNHINIENIDAYFEESDIYNIKIKPIDNEIVYLINSIFLEEEEEGITFLSDINLYKSIENYEKNKDLILQKNYNNLKKMLKKNTNINDNINFNDKNKEKENISMINHNIISKFSKNDFMKIFDYCKEKNVLKDESDIKEFTFLFNLMLNMAPLTNENEQYDFLNTIIGLVEFCLFEDNNNINNYNENKKKKVMNFLELPLVKFVLYQLIENKKINKISNLIKYIKK